MVIKSIPGIPRKILELKQKVKRFKSKSHQFSSMVNIQIFYLNQAVKLKILLQNQGALVIENQKKFGFSRCLSARYNPDTYLDIHGRPLHWPSSMGRRCRKANTRYSQGRPCCVHIYIPDADHHIRGVNTR